MSEDLRSLLERLKNAQRDLLRSAASQPVLPSDGMLRKIADLEQAIVATEALIEEQAG